MYPLEPGFAVSEVYSTLPPVRSGPEETSTYHATRAVSSTGTSSNMLSSLACYSYRFSKLKFYSSSFSPPPCPACSSYLVYLLLSRVIKKEAVVEENSRGGDSPGMVDDNEDVKAYIRNCRTYGVCV